MRGRGNDGWVGLVTVVRGVWEPLHAGDGSFQGVSISMTSPGGPSVGVGVWGGENGDIISLFDGRGSGLVTVSTTFQLATGKRWVLTLLAFFSG